MKCFIKHTKVRFVEELCELKINRSRQLVILHVNDVYLDIIHSWVIRENQHPVLKDWVAVGHGLAGHLGLLVDGDAHHNIWLGLPLGKDVGAGVKVDDHQGLVKSQKEVKIV